METDESAIVFESDFGADTGYFVTRLGLWNGGSSSPVAPPAGWDGVLATGEGRISVEEGQGVGGANALKLEWDAAQAQPTLSLVKHLSGDTGTGYDELYIRYHVRLPENFKAGRDGSFLPHWKWGRLWQNTDPTGQSVEHNWSENRENSHYVMWAAGGGIPYTMFRAAWGANEGPNRERGSAGGPYHNVDWFVSGSTPHESLGYFENIGGGAWRLVNDGPDRGTLYNGAGQGWHTIEFRFKLASEPGADDGVFEQWYDGEYQGSPTRITSGYGAPPASGITTARMGSGFNFFTFFDNVGGWVESWSDPRVGGHIWVNDVVVSTSRIGHEYVVRSGLS